MAQISAEPSPRHPIHFSQLPQHQNPTGKRRKLTRNLKTLVFPISAKTPTKPKLNYTGNKSMPRGRKTIPQAKKKTRPQVAGRAVDAGRSFRQKSSLHGARQAPIYAGICSAEQGEANRWGAPVGSGGGGGCDRADSKFRSGRAFSAESSARREGVSFKFLPKR